MSKSKAQGTRFETELVNALNRVSTDIHARRLAEGGSNDEGDVEILDGRGDRWVVECKATERLNVTRVLAKAREKGGWRTVLAWRRLVKTGKQKRQPDGEKVVVVMPLDVFLEVIDKR